jgi:dihydropteroate synthase
MLWQTSKRKIDLSSPIVMGILNVTPDSFSDGGRFAELDAAVRRAEVMIGEGAAIIDIGGESTRPGSESIDPEIEMRRTLPVAAEISKRFEIPVSIDTSKWSVAKMLIDHGGAEIINDISGLRWDARIADVAARSGAGLILMHSRGTFETMHAQPPVEDVLTEVRDNLQHSVSIAKKWGVKDEQIVLDIGIGFGKTVEQNLELLAKLDTFADTISNPLLVGVSRKSFIGKILDGAPPDERLSGSIAAAVAAVMNGARIIRAHDVKPTVDAIRIASAVTAQKKRKGVR